MSGAREAALYGNRHLIECLWFLCTRNGKLPIDPKARLRSKAGLAAKLDLRPEGYARNTHALRLFNSSLILGEAFLSI